MKCVEPIPGLRIYFDENRRGACRVTDLEERESFYENLAATNNEELQKQKLNYDFCEAMGVDAAMNNFMNSKGYQDALKKGQEDVRKMTETQMNKLMTLNEAIKAYGLASKIPDYYSCKLNILGLVALGLLKLKDEVKDEVKQPEADFVTVAHAIRYAYSALVPGEISDKTANALAKVAIATYEKLKANSIEIVDSPRPVDRDHLKRDFKDYMKDLETSLSCNGVKLEYYETEIKNIKSCIDEL